MQFNLKIILLMVLLLVSTHSNGQKKINSLPLINIEANINNMKKINLSQFTDNIRYLPLELNNDYPIGEIISLTISDKYILISDFKSCLLYDTQGHFLRSIGKNGRGPGEYQFLVCSRIYNDKIFLQSVFDLFEYKVDGSFVRKIKNRFMFNNSTYQYTRNWIIINDSFFFSHMPNPTGDIQYKALLTDNAGNIIKPYKNYILFNREKALTITEDDADIHQFNKKIFLKEYYNDTIFYLDEQFKLVPKYTFYLGKYKLPISVREKPIVEFAKSQANFIFIPKVFETDKYLIFKSQFGNHFPGKRINPILVNLPDGSVQTKWYNTTFALGIYSKLTNSISFCEPTSTDNPLFTSGIYNDFDAGPRFFPEIQVNDSTLVMWIKAGDLIKHTESKDFQDNIPKYLDNKKQLKRLADSFSELDNPVLMFVTFKN